MQKFNRIFFYLFSDIIGAIIFVIYGVSQLNQVFQGQIKTYLSCMLFLICLYVLSGTYVQIIRKSRFKELALSLNQSLIILIALILLNYHFNILKKENLYSLLSLGLLHTGILYTFRLIFLSVLKSKLIKGKIGFNTLIVGQAKMAEKIYTELSTQNSFSGFRFLGYVAVENIDNTLPSSKLKNIGFFSDINKFIDDLHIEEVIVAMDAKNHTQLKSILDELETTNTIINIIPDMFSIVSGFVKTNYLYAVPLITLYPQNMPLWQRAIKKLIDYLMAIIALIILSPLFILIALFIKSESKGSAIFKQSRIGKKGIPFDILKFRTMYSDAEKNGPALSKNNDPRVTAIGKILRKTRLDELPQFINILKGEMSLVGPRPERQFYIDQIIQKAPHYHYLHKVLPGITSWGQVKYGYAENVEQMIQRLTYDILYVENRTLALDFKIMFYTIITVIQRRGK